ncbi:MAG: biotin/lipoyl-binding protein, partial [Hyphomicrobiales bacterium]|nr:biotin/lipoyl-binding protein [Hyphomicrobiales bacterium]
YDPMIAKLCVHAPTRAGAITGMNEALDAFFIDGIQHNIPFLSDLMRHARWREGRLSTSFIAEEYPDGFTGGHLDAEAEMLLSAVAATVELSNRYRFEDSAERHFAPREQRMDWVVRLDGHPVEIHLPAGFLPAPIECEVVFGADGGSREVRSDWRPGDLLWTGTVGDRRLTVQVRRALNGWRLTWRGITVKAEVMTERIAELATLMPEKVPPDTSKMLLCPMPGLVVSIAVSEGQEVKAGEILAIVEAMKMENVLRAERDLTIAAIKAQPGDSLAVDAVIMEFE